MVGGQSVYPGYGRKILKDVGVIEHHWHSRWRVYPQDVASTARLTAFAGADTFGSWYEIIPLNTVPFSFDILGLVIEEISAVGTYFIQIGYNTVNADPGPNMELGERRIKLSTQPVSRATELLTIQSQEVPANGRVMGRLKTASGAADWADISIVLDRHLNVEDEVPLYPRFPW